MPHISWVKQGKQGNKAKKHTLFDSNIIQGQLQPQLQEGLRLVLGGEAPEVVLHCSMEHKGGERRGTCPTHRAKWARDALSLEGGWVPLEEARVRTHCNTEVRCPASPPMPTCPLSHCRRHSFAQGHSNVAGHAAGEPQEQGRDTHLLGAGGIRAQPGVCCPKSLHHRCFRAPPPWLLPRSASLATHAFFPKSSVFPPLLVCPQAA